MQTASANHYATLGLDRQCSPEQIRAAYRLLAKQLHPDLNPHSQDAHARTQALNLAHEILSDPKRREIYDNELDAIEKERRSRTSNIEKNISQDVLLHMEEFFRGATFEVQVDDPANPEGREIYSVNMPPDTAPGTRLRLQRTGFFVGGFVFIRLRMRPGFRFTARGSDLKCDLRISPARASQGGTETLPGPDGNVLRVAIPRGVGRGEIIRVPGLGLPKPRGGRGDLLVKITYPIRLKISRQKR